MSEYQYYEFLAIDRPLTSEEMSDLRDLSTRAHITPASFTNEYHWGDLKERPSVLMKRFFDSHVYVANFMTAVFMVRVPIEVIPEETALAAEVRHILDFKSTKTHWVITWRLNDSEDYDRFGMEDGRGWMARLTPIRDELMRGDFRSLYVGWLAAVSREMVGDEDMEPLPVEGLENLTSAQRALAEFIEVDEDLLAGAGIGTPDTQKDAPTQTEKEDWLAGLPRDEVKSLLKLLLAGKGQQAESSLKNRFAAWQRSLRSDSGTPGRMVETLWQNAEEAKKHRTTREKREQKKLEAKRRKERKAFLKRLADNLPKAWESVQMTVKRGSGLAYDEACSALVNLSEAYSLYDDKKAFQQALKKFMGGHMRRKALIQRLSKAGIWRTK